MSKLGHDLINSLTDLKDVLADDASPEGYKVTPSCGCIFCDLGRKPIKLQRQYVHFVRGRHYRFVVCPITGIRSSTADAV